MAVENWDVFISYRRKDAAAFARWIRRRMLRFRLPAEIVERLSPEAAALHARRPQIWLDIAYERPSDDFLLQKVFPALDTARRSWSLRHGP